jgi:hypothetical protein
LFIAKFRKKWSLICNLKKTKVVVFKKGGKVKRNERWHMEGQKLEVLSEIIYLGVKLKSTGGWRRQKAWLKTIGNQSILMSH